MKKLILLTSLMFIASLIYGYQVWAGGPSVCTASDEIEQYINVEMYDDAIQCAKDYISPPKGRKNITDYEAHFLWGKACFLKADYSCAENRFNVDGVKNKYNKTIASLYRNAADGKINKGDFNSAQNFYGKSAQYDFEQGVKIAKNLFDLAMQNERASNDLLIIASNLDPAIKKKIAEHFYSLCAATSGETSVALLKRANYYADGKYSEELKEKQLQLGYQYLNEAKLLAKIPGKEKETEIKKEKAGNYLGREFIQNELPEYRNYRPRPEPYHFSLKAGEQTDHWIAFPVGDYKYNFNSGGSFKVIYDDGEIVDSRTAKGLPKKTNEMFKIQAINDQELEMNLTSL